MTDLTDLLDRAAGRHDAPAPHQLSQDIARGRRALRRRRGLQVCAGLVLVGAAVSVAALPTGGDQVQVAVPVASPSPDDPPNPGVDLVQYDGSLHGAAFRPAEVPSGWSVGGGTSGMLVAPPGESAELDSSFEGKIFVYLEREYPDEPLPTNRPIAVGDRTGYIVDAYADGLQVYVMAGEGVVLRVQAPGSLGWDHVTLARFLAGVTVLPEAHAACAAGSTARYSRVEDGYLVKVPEPSRTQAEASCG